MLSGVFRFVLPELSSHFVLRDLLRSLRLERPLSSSRVPPWDLSRVLSFLRSPPFEPLSSCSLRDLTRKVLFLVSLATALRVGELQAVSVEVSSSGKDLFLTYLPEFRDKSESEARPLPRFFRVRSLSDFVGSLPDELFSVLFMLFAAIFLGLLHFLLALDLSLFPLVLLLIFCRRVLLVSSFGMSLRSPILRRVFLFLPCPRLRLSPLPLVLGACVWGS